MSREHILIVDDEKLIRWSIRSRLKKEGYAVDEAEDGKEAFRRLQDEECDLLLLDYRLLDTTGSRAPPSSRSSSWISGSGSIRPSSTAAGSLSRRLEPPISRTP